MRFRTVHLVTLLASVSMLTAAAPSTSRADLDTYTDARLYRDLGDELNDILEGLEDDDEVSLDELPGAILDALSDDGDSGFELDIRLADLEDEMEEAGTDLETVIAESLERSAQGFASRGPQTKHPRTVKRLQSVTGSIVGAIRTPPRRPPQHGPRALRGE